MVASLLAITSLVAQGQPARLVENSIKLEKATLPREAETATPGNRVLGEDWYVIEAKFDTTEELTEEITVKFYTDMVDTLKKNETIILTSEVTFINVPKGNGHVATAYLHPAAVSRYGGSAGKDGIKKANVHVDLMENGRSNGPGLDLRKDQPNWFSSFPQVPGVLVNLKDSPFWPMEQRKFNQIKAATR
ncbi:MAG: hypothetical protein SFU85_03305 [Candidatus Methylacidiphilales bacterium]|nr:hypothetical protein [Candidatus Methylacidiphilales bacterium]